MGSRIGGRPTVAVAPLFLLSGAGATLLAVHGTLALEAVRVTDRVRFRREDLDGRASVTLVRGRHALGFGYEELSSLNPRLVMVSISPFGQDGPWRDLRMNDAAHLALGGQMASSGYSDPAATPIGSQRKTSFGCCGA